MYKSHHSSFINIVPSGKKNAFIYSQIKLLIDHLFIYTNNMINQSYQSYKY